MESHLKHKIILFNSLNKLNSNNNNSSSSFSSSPSFSSFNLSSSSLSKDLKKGTFSIFYFLSFSFFFSLFLSISLKDNLNNSKDNSKQNENKNFKIFSNKEYSLWCNGFSLSVIPIVGIFTFSSTIFSLHSSGIGNFLFCFGYTISSLFYTKIILLSYGCKYSLLFGHIGSIIFVSLYLICITFAYSYSSIIYPIGAFIGGISQSIM